MERISLCLFFALVLLANSAQAPAQSTWLRSYDLIGTDVASSVHQTTDGGFIISIYTDSTGAGSYDFWILKLAADGSTEWQKTYGGSGLEYDASVQQTSDGGYIVSGFTSSPPAVGLYDLFLLKLGAAGNVEWNKLYNNGTGADDNTAVRQTNDGGYILAGTTSGSNFDTDIWVLKLNASGTIVWQKSYGGSANEDFADVRQTTDGGYIVAGTSNSFGSAGENDYWVLKLASDGPIQWQYAYLTSDSETAAAVKQTVDGGYVVAGYAHSSVLNDDNMRILKLNSAGLIEWLKEFGEEVDILVFNERALTVLELPGGGYLVGGTATDGGTSSLNDLFELDSNGNWVWGRNTTDLIPILDINQSADGSIVAVGGASQGVFAKINSDGMIGANCPDAVSGIVSRIPTVIGMASNASPVDTAATINELTLLQVSDITVNPIELCAGCPEIILSPPTLPDGQVTVPYNETVFASGGAAPYTFAVTAGSLPAGLALDAAAGVISGTPTSVQSAAFTITVTDANGCGNSHVYTMNITPLCPPIILSPATLPDGVTGVSYNQMVSASGGTAPYTYAVTTGALPSGLTLDASTGAISGVPNAVGSANFTIAATDSGGCIGSQAYSVIISDITACLFCDDFEDGVLDPNWSYLKPAWSETNGDLVATPQGKAVAIATPVFAGCRICTVETEVETSGGAGNKIWLLGWYVDKKNAMEFLIKEPNDKILMKQRLGGAIVKKQSAEVSLSPNTKYRWTISFDGAQFVVMVDSVTVMTFVPAGAVPAGTVGFQVKKTIGTFGSILVQ